MRIIGLLAALLVLSGAAFAQDPGPACRPNARGAIDWARCAEMAPQGSEIWRLAMLNLGTQAHERGDFAEAARYYDAADPGDGRVMYSDPAFHALRADVYFGAGRLDDALADARIALAMVTRDESLPPVVLEAVGRFDVDLVAVYAMILPVLREGGDARYDEAFAAFEALPAASFSDFTNRAIVYRRLGDHPRAIDASTRAVALAPEHPAVLNNHCYVLTTAGRAAEGLPFCEGAIAAAPRVGVVRHSYAAALAGVGRCEDAARELQMARDLDPSNVDLRRDIACAAAP